MVEWRGVVWEWVDGLGRPAVAPVVEAAVVCWRIGFSLSVGIWNGNGREKEE